MAMALKAVLESAGCTVIGPFATLAAAEDAADNEDLDGAILDINLRGELVFPLAERLLDRRVPIVFCSSYVGTIPLPKAFASCACLPKPYTDDMLLGAVRKCFTGFGGGGWSSQPSA